MALSDFFKWLPFGKVPELAPEKVLALVTDGSVQILDVRTQEEWRRSHISGAMNLPIMHFSRENVGALGLDQQRPVIAVCLSAHRSIPAVRQLKAMGFSEVYQLESGMRKWWQLGLPCEQPQ